MQFIQNMMRARRRRKAAQELRGLSPEILRDIGIEPDQVGRVAADMAAGRETEMERYRRPEPDALLYKASLFMPIDWAGPKPRIGFKRGARA
ncbi:DUF1127 domain-containing protein [Afifella pfennigii]|uniref:DUF1127 domain-containing protein n=1 Tax=Afifella pfennigii TaxID=209897 RepID=UPI00047ED78C|nr:DUF1127 domain-containing protein [Afifella pfennigii]